MRILHYIQSVDFENGGPPRAVVDQVATMKARGNQAGLASTVTVDVPQDWLDEPHRDEHPEVVALSPVVGPLSRLTRASVRTIREAIRRYDIVHLHGVWEPSNLQVAAECRRLAKPYVVSLRGMLDDWSMDQSPLRKRVFLRCGGRRYLEEAKAVHCTAIAELEQSRKWFPQGHGVVVPNLINLAPYQDVPSPIAAFERWPDLESVPFRVLFLSRIQYKKGIEHLVDAVAILRERGRSLRVVVAGTGDDGYLEDVRRRAETRGIADLIDWVGHVGGELKLSLYSAADVFALPTSQENFGFVFFESLAAGTPVITTDLVDTRSEILDSGGGVIVPQTGAAFAEALESFMTGERSAEEMGSKGREWTLENLSTEVVAAAFEDLYGSSVVTEPPTPARWSSSI